MNTRTEFLIYKMLTENTGSAMLDSGDAYGRHWENNKQRTIDDFKNDKINILIATSVIEEGLDVSTCNLVVSINEVLNVKSFI